MEADGAFDMVAVFKRSFAELQALIGEELNVNPQSITPETRFVSLGIDSLEMLSFIIEFEEWAGTTVESPKRILRVQDLMNVAGIP